MKTQSIKSYPDIVSLINVRVAIRLLLSVEDRPVKGELCAVRASSSTGDRTVLYKFRKRSLWENIKGRVTSSLETRFLQIIFLHYKQFYSIFRNSVLVSILDYNPSDILKKRNENECLVLLFSYLSFFFFSSFFFHARQMWQWRKRKGQLGDRRL